MSAAGQLGPPALVPTSNVSDATSLITALSHNTTGDKTLSLSDHSGAVAVAVALSNLLLFAVALFVVSSSSPNFIVDSVALFA